MMTMIRIFQALDAYGEQRVLLLAVQTLDFVPNQGEHFDINGKNFLVLHVQHYLDTATMDQSLELTVIPPENMIDIEFIGEEEEEDEWRI